MSNTAKKIRFSSREINSVALEAFFNIAGLWKISAAEGKKLLGLKENSSCYFKWKKDLAGSLFPDHLDRVSYIVGIYKALRIIFSDEKQANEWIKKPNKTFNGKSALEVMLQGKITDLARVRGYLDAQRGW